MKQVVQGESITFDIRFYDKEVESGGVPVDPDNYLHTWEIQNDVNNRVNSITLLDGAVFPSLPKFYFSIIDSGADFEVKGYDDAARTNEIVSTGSLAYGVYTDQALNEVGGSGYSGTISVTFPGIGGGVENFEIEDIGSSEPTYEIINNDNVVIVASSLITTRIAVGYYQVTYDALTTDIPGSNWRIVSRGRIDAVDAFLTEYFRVIEVAVAEYEKSKLVTLEEAKTGLEIEGDDDDALIENWIVPASRAVEQFCGQNFHIDSCVKKFSGTGYEKIHVEIPGPIKSITSLKYKAHWNSSWTILDLDKIDYSSFFLFRVDGGVFDIGQRNWEIEYEYGFEYIPGDVKQAVIEVLKFMYVTKNRVDSKSDVIGGGLRIEYTEPKPELTEKAKVFLQPYRRMF